MPQNYNDDNDIVIRNQRILAKYNLQKKPIPFQPTDYRSIMALGGVGSFQPPAATPEQPQPVSIQPPQSSPIQTPQPQTNKPTVGRRISEGLGAAVKEGLTGLKLGPEGYRELLLKRELAKTPEQEQAEREQSFSDWQRRVDYTKSIEPAKEKTEMEMLRADAYAKYKAGDRSPEVLGALDLPIEKKAESPSPSDEKTAAWNKRHAEIEDWLAGMEEPFEHRGTRDYRKPTEAELVEHGFEFKPEKVEEGRLSDMQKQQNANDRAIIADNTGAYTPEEKAAAKARILAGEPAAVKEITVSRAEIEASGASPEEFDAKVKEYQAAGYKVNIID